MIFFLLAYFSFFDFVVDFWIFLIFWSGKRDVFFIFLILGMFFSFVLFFDFLFWVKEKRTFFDLFFSCFFWFFWPHLARTTFETIFCLCVENLGQWGCSSGQFVAHVLFFGRWTTLRWTSLAQDLCGIPRCGVGVSLLCCVVSCCGVSVRCVLKIFVGASKIWALLPTLSAGPASPDSTPSARPPSAGPPKMGLHTTARELQTCTFEGPGFGSHQIHETTPPREEERMKTVAGRGKKSAKFWAPHPSGPPPFGPHFYLVWAPTLRGPDPSGPHNPGPFPSVPQPSGHQSSRPLRGTPPPPDSPHCFWVVVCAVLLLILLLVDAFGPQTVDSLPSHLCSV